MAAGGMGKVVGTMVGVLLIGAYDTIHQGRATAKAHLARILPAAYTYGAAYAVVDDTLHDLPGDYVPPADRAHVHRMILRGLTAGSSIDPAEIPDHPLAEELADLHRRMLGSYPRPAYTHLYRAAESMYLAQHRDSANATDAIAPADPMERHAYRFVKAGMSRVVANILGRRKLRDDFYARCVNTIAASQWRDDLRDHEDDLRAGRCTPFTMPAGHAGTNPLYDLFAYSAYVAAEVFGGRPTVTDVLTHRAAGILARYLSTEPQRADALARRYETTGELARFLRVASGLSKRTVGQLDFADQKLKRHAGRVFAHREQTSVDCRTFALDRMAYLDDVLQRHRPRTGTAALDDIVAYSVAGLRSACDRCSASCSPKDSA